MTSIRLLHLHGNFTNQPIHCSQLLRLRRICNDDRNFLMKSIGNKTISRQAHISLPSVGHRRWKSFQFPVQFLTLTRQNVSQTHTQALVSAPRYVPTDG